MAPLDRYSRTVDHLIPKSKGGILSNDNKVSCCKTCNQLKANMDPFEFKRFINFMITFEKQKHSEKIGYLKKISLRVEELISKRKTNDSKFQRFKKSDQEPQKVNS